MEKVLYERRYLSPRPPPKISLKNDHDWTKGNDQLGSTVEHRAVGKLVQQSLGETLQAGSPKPTQSLNPIGDRTEKPVTQEIVGKLQGEHSSSDRTGELVKDEDKRVMKDHDRTGKPVEASSHLSNIVILYRQTRTSSTKRLISKTSISTSHACQMRW